MKDRLERFVLLPFTAGCISESSIPVVEQHTKRSKQGQHKKEKEESLSGQNWKTTLPRFQKLYKNFKNLSQLLVYTDELEPEMEIEIEIGLPTDVKHVAHVGMDGCTSSIFSKGWNNLAEQELINLHSFPLSELELAIKGAQAETPNIRSSFETKCHVNHNINNAISQ